MSGEIAHIALEPGPSRFCTLTQKIDGARTGFRSAVFVHMDYTPQGRIVAIRLSEKQKDDNPIDRLLHAVGDEITSMLGQVQGR